MERVVRVGNVEAKKAAHRTGIGVEYLCGTPFERERERVYKGRYREVSLT